MQLLKRDGFAGIDAALVDPALYLVEVDCGHLDGVPEALALAHPVPTQSTSLVQNRVLILKPPDALDADQRRLTTSESTRYFAMLSLTSVASPRSFALAGSWTSSSSNAFIVGSGCIRQGA